MQISISNEIFLSCEIAPFSAASVFTNHLNSLEWVWLASCQKAQRKTIFSGG